MQGWNVATEVKLTMLYDGVMYEMRADLVWTVPGVPGFGVTDVKTGDDPDLTKPQQYILPGIANGLAVNIWGGYDGNHPITSLGFTSGQLLPQGEGYVTIYYQRDEFAQPTSTYLRPNDSPYPIPYRWKAPGGSQ
jgi:hypothetical protein